MTDTSLAVRGSFDEVEKVASAMVKSGYFVDTKDASQAIVKIMAGREMGFGAFASMTGVYIIQGRPSVGANLMASAVKRSGRYDYRVLEMTDKVCTIEYMQGGKPIGQSSFTIEDARKAQTKNLDKFPRNMLFARAMSNGVRWYCPDVFDGAPVYTPEEMGANVNEAGDVIDYTPPTVTIYEQPATPPPAHQTTDREGQVMETLYEGKPAAKAAPVELSQRPTPPQRPYSPTILKEGLTKKGNRPSAKLLPGEMEHTTAALEVALGGSDQRHEFIRWLTDNETASMKDLKAGMVLALRDWLKPSYNKDAKVYEIGDQFATAEATAAHREYLQANGAQGELL